MWLQKFKRVENKNGKGYCCYKTSDYTWMCFVNHDNDSHALEIKIIQDFCAYCELSLMIDQTIYNSYKGRKWRLSFVRSHTLGQFSSTTKSGIIFHVNKNGRRSLKNLKYKTSQLAEEESLFNILQRTLTNPYGRSFELQILHTHQLVHSSTAHIFCRHDYKGK